ncbi:uncharacterized protein At5g01610-like [Lycium ferocissimum]|uniref:uncharacterized protein At5g01610-like n=1 Tax=Lycium ferocissimum TaxID=112874 RepID=UPI002815A868|nr:uncharacterized protein At5g01610-like [Lycium ferocissimum]
MSSATISLFLLFFSAAVAANEKPSAYEELRHYDFPIGILPKGVIGYELNPKTGEFSAYLNGSCSFMLSSYELYYKPVIKGVISKGRLRKLSGVSVKVVLLWLNIVEVRRRGDNLQFSVGITSANFPIRRFEECPRCECGQKVLASSS